MYTWLPCFHQFVAAAASVRPTMTSQFMAYANTIQYEGDGWRAYDRAFRLKVAGHASVDWATIGLPLYTRFFTAPVQRGNSCRDCGGAGPPQYLLSVGCGCGAPCGHGRPPYHHPQCVQGPPHSASTGTPTVRPRAPTAPECTLRNNETCKFPTTCNFRHLCSLCSGEHRVIACPTRPWRTRHCPTRHWQPQWPAPPPGPQHFRSEPPRSPLPPTTTKMRLRQWIGLALLCVRVCLPGGRSGLLN